MNQNTNNSSCSLDHAVINDRGICLTCGLAKDIREKLDSYNNRNEPASRWCSECGSTIIKSERFRNFAWGKSNISTICENCRIKIREIKKPRKSKLQKGDSVE